jgi:hypothetical protein
MRFDGDIVITDPVYIVSSDDWNKCKNGKDISVLGFENFMVDETICGDWQCYIVDDKNKQIGHITADSGLSGVFLINEITKYSKKISSYIKQDKYIATVINDFHGDIQFSKSVQDNIEYTKIKGIGNINFQNFLDI